MPNIDAGTEQFFRLTPDWVVRAVEDAGFEPTGHCQSLHCFENRVYDLRLEDGQHVIAKFYRPGRWSEAAIQEEHDFLLDLEAAEIPVCVPAQFPGGGTLRAVEDIWYSVWPRTGGRAPSELDDEETAILGRLLARIHNAGAERPMAHRPALSSEHMLTRPTAFLVEQGFLPPQFVSRYQAAGARIAAVYDQLAATMPAHRIHGDCHFGNLLLGRDGWFFLDFDDCAMGPAVQDFWLLLPGRDAETLAQRQRFVEAYQQFREFDGTWLRAIEALRGMRFVHYAAWVARRWEDPAFPRAFPHFNTEQYWQKETIDLEEQATLAEAAAEGEGATW